MSEQQKPDPLEELPPDKLKAVLQSLEAEKERRREALIAAGKLIVIPVTMVVGKMSDKQREAFEAEKPEKLAKHLAAHPEDRGKAVEWNVLWIVTGVQRRNELGDGGPIGGTDRAAVAQKE